jgi:hypothetical protein|tara:strand:- start:417 stop:1364 length:948 start_codon:yes stop_codon:yes gene_type:complete
MSNDKKVGLVEVLALIKTGSSPAKISKKYNIPKQNISYFVVKLKKLGCIRKKGYGVWEYVKPLKQVKEVPQGSMTGKGLTSHKKEIRGHAFIWKIQFVHSYDWKKIVRAYKKKKLTFQLISSGKVYRTIFNNRKIWLNTKGLTIYEPMDFYGGSSFKVKGDAVYQMDKLIKDLLFELGQKFKPYRFTTSREHYGMIKNELARQYNEKKEKMYIKGEDGTVWLWIDDSKGLGELETKDPVISRKVQEFWNDHKKHNFEVTASFVLGSLGLLAKNFEYHSENMRSHVVAVQDLGSGVQKFNEKIDQLIEIIKEKRDL